MPNKQNTMWTMDKPLLDKAFTEDVDALVDHCRSLGEEHKTPLKILYRQYNMSNGIVTDQQLAPLAPKKDIIKDQYTSKVKKGNQSLSYMRLELMSGITKCPFCGIADVTTLDHYMDKGTYGQLACCRLNLVPSCWKCNHLKDSKPHTGFIHAYYDRLPDVEFLKIEVTLNNNKIGVIFSIDATNIGNQILSNKVTNQFNVFNDDNRIIKACVDYLNDYLDGLDCDAEESLRMALSRKYEKNKKRYGLNHWKSAVIKGLIENESFNVEVLRSIVS